MIAEITHRDCIQHAKGKQFYVVKSALPHRHRENERQSRMYNVRMSAYCTKRKKATLLADFYTFFSVMNILETRQHLFLYTNCIF